MQIVYNLVMMDMESSYDNHNEEFNIGFFSSRSIAEKTAAKYQQEVNGFKDYPVTYQIKEKNIISASITQLDVFIIYGWNENDELDEIDVVESDCYSSMEEAETQLHEMKKRFHRKEWCIDKYRIDKCYWQEGFEKVFR